MFGTMMLPLVKKKLAAELNLGELKSFDFSVNYLKKTVDINGEDFTGKCEVITRDINNEKLSGYSDMFLTYVKDRLKENNTNFQEIEIAVFCWDKIEGMKSIVCYKDLKGEDCKNEFKI